MSHDHHLKEQLKALHLGGLLETLDVRLREARKSQLAHLDFLALLVQDELERRAWTKFDRRVRKACFSELRSLEEFDFAFNPKIDRSRVFDLATCRFIERRENVFFCGPVGVGKSHLALALGHEAVRRGHEVRYAQAARLFRALLASRADDSRERTLKRYLACDCLIIDDFGLKPLTPVEADDFYDIVYERYLKGSLVLTSNRAVQEWSALFPDPIQSNSLMDRLCHNAHQLEWEGESYRKRQRPRAADGKEARP